MASENISGVSLPPQSANRQISPGPSQRRQRGLGRAVNLADGTSPLNRRRSSLFSENISETRNSLRSSTEDLFLPRVNGASVFDSEQEPSHWHSIPLGLALLPAVVGVFIKNGSAVVTDITLLALAAIFLNWSVRLPWYADRLWYEQIVS